jgi:Zn-dependent peptidase ImmA (M78 family)/transcriptional regulator with XRE-family HTH domain
MRMLVKPKLLRWAYERAGLEPSILARRFPKLQEWEEGKSKPTLKQLEAFAKRMYVPLGYLFLQAPPQEELPIQDFRTMGSNEKNDPSPNLLETIYACQQRQEWYRNYQQICGNKELDFVGSVTTKSDIVDVAVKIRKALNFDLEQRAQIANWTEAFRLFIEKVEKQNILVMVNGVVGSNNYRKLDPAEFRGFVLVDDLAPLIFINATDTKAAQMFTLAHELAHIWLGKTGLSDIQVVSTPSNKVEKWCNQVAAELLVPLADIERNYNTINDVESEMGRLAKYYKVSTLVVLRRIFDLEVISQELFWEIYWLELARLKSFAKRKGGGGDFYRTLSTRVSKRFIRAVVGSTLEGQTLFRDAYRMLGIRKSATFEQVAEHIGYQI